ncbi:MAG TPA: diacylglycerol kinase family protein [Candidatus Ruthenibacterium merdigallinarum]|nr:diacylglycerol kinase family protein [Candidatus Ruthenibacterium merdigallinarum]
MDKQPFYASFLYAAQGVRTAVRQERNMRFHLCAAFYVYLFSLFYDFTKTEYCLLTVMVAGVLALELVNSSLERTVERPAPSRYRTAGVVKDMAAGAVLVFSIGCAVCGVLLFWDVAVFREILAFFAGHPAALAALCASLVCSWLFIFREKGA